MVPRTPHVGDVVAQRYRLTRQLGEGGFGTVFEAECADGAQHVALKILHVALGDNSIEVKRFEREARLAQEIRHPHVVRTLDIGCTERGLPYIVLELLQGCSLRQRLKSGGAWAVATTAELALQVLDGLSAAHALGVVHRDIKPANIFLCQEAGPKPFVKVLDFGIAKALGGELGQGTKLTATGQMLGTPAYMAPEQARGEPIDCATDLYSLGLVLAEMVGGQRVVTGESEIELLMAHVGPEPHELPAAVRESPLGPVIERALRKTSGERFPSAADMRAAVAQALGAGLPHGVAAPNDHAPAVAAQRTPPPVAGPPAPTLIAQPYATQAPGALPTGDRRSVRGHVGLVVGLVLAFGLAVGGGGALVWRLLGDAPDRSHGSQHTEPQAKASGSAASDATDPSAPGSGVLERLSYDEMRGRIRALGFTLRGDPPEDRQPILVFKNFTISKGELAGTVNLHRWTSLDLAKRQEQGLLANKSWAACRDGKTVLGVGMVRGDSGPVLRGLLGAQGCPSGR